MAYDQTKFKTTNIIGEEINPATSENQVENNESLVLLRRMVKMMESNAVVDGANRQRILVEGVTSILPSSYYAAAQQWNLTSNSIPISNNGTNVTYIQPVQTGPVDPRWAIIDQARLVYDQGIRSHLSFS